MEPERAGNGSDFSWERLKRRETRQRRSRAAEGRLLQALLDAHMHTAHTGRDISVLTLPSPKAPTLALCYQYILGSSIMLVSSFQCLYGALLKCWISCQDLPQLEAKSRGNLAAAVLSRAPDSTPLPLISGRSRTTR